MSGSQETVEAISDDVSKTRSLSSSSTSSDDSDYDADRGFGNGRPSTKPFICGVVEGFYGRPWNTNQRAELFSRMKRFGMNMYLYAPKDDVKHRAYWRDMYTVEEADSLTELISAAAKHDVKFVYAISPGLDITYSSNKDLTILRRKLDQVSSFGCKSFALLFDDIETEMTKADKEVFQSFAHAQVAVTNQMYEHLKQPDFLFCPTEYCASRAVPTVRNSPYLNVIGKRLLPGIEIMWTGPKVVSKVISLSSIKQLSRVLRRPPLIWDNIHANDYDHRRVFLGPFSGRSPLLIPYLSGVLTNPNCEFEPNYIALHTLGTWSRASSDEKPQVITPETLVEREGTPKLEDISVIPSGYEPRQALKLALLDWMPTLYSTTHADGSRPLAKLALAPNPDDIPATVSTCMSVTPTTNSAPADVALSAVIGDVKSPANAEEGSESEPMDVIAAVLSANELPEKNLLPNSLAPVSDDIMQVDEDIGSSADKLTEDDKLTIADLELICDMFYLPYEHGSQASFVLTEFEWLKLNAHVLNSHKKNGVSSLPTAHLVTEWKDRAAEFNDFVRAFGKIVENFAKIPNRCLLYDMNSYLWDLRGTLSLLNAFVKWLASGLVREIDAPGLEYRLTWSSKGYGQAFMSGDNEPWVFRGGLTGELQRLLPTDATDLLMQQTNPELALKATSVYTIRPYLPSDEASVYAVCKQINKVLLSPDEVDSCPDALLPDLLVGGMLMLSSQYCFVVEDDNGICGYAVGVPDADDYHNKMTLSWLPEMKVKYPAESDDVMEETSIQRLVRQFHDYKPENSHELLSSYPALVRMEILPHVQDSAVTKRALACLFAALKSVGVHGAHSVVETNPVHLGAMYRYLGFVLAEPSFVTTMNDSSAVLVRNI